MPEITIGDEVYELKAADNWFEFTKRSDKALYRVGLVPGYCECLDFKYRGAQRPCKHVLALWSHLLSTETKTKEQTEDAEFTATEAPAANLPAVLPQAVPAVPLGRVLASVPRLAGALIRAQKQCRAVGKDARNAFHKYDYASAEAIIEEAKEPLNDCGLALMPVGLHVNGHEKEGEARFELEREFLLLHESGESVPIKCHWPICPDKGRPLDKATASADTTSLAYTLRDLLLMPRVNKADDMNARNDAPQPEKADGAAKPAPKPKREEPAKEEVASPEEPVIGREDMARLAELIAEHKVPIRDLCKRFKVKDLTDLKASQYRDVLRWITGNLPITEEQQKKIRGLIDEMKVPATTVKDRLHDLYRADNLSQLKQIQADDLVGRLLMSRAVKNAPAVPAGAA